MAQCLPMRMRRQSDATCTQYPGQGHHATHAGLRSRFTSQCIRRCVPVPVNRGFCFASDAAVPVGLRRDAARDASDVKHSVTFSENRSLKVKIYSSSLRLPAQAYQSESARQT